MLTSFFFVLGIVNNALLIVIFMLRKYRLDLIRRFGWIYLLLTIPAIYGIFLAVHDGASRYAIFLGIFLAYLLMEWLFDHILSPVYRESWRQSWKWLTPYLVLYYAMNYGFVVMPRKTSLVWGLVMLVLFVVQIIANIRSHPGTGQRTLE